MSGAMMEELLGMGVVNFWRGGVLEAWSNGVMEYWSIGKT